MTLLEQETNALDSIAAEIKGQKADSVEFQDLQEILNMDGISITSKEFLNEIESYLTEKGVSVNYRLNESVAFKNRLKLNLNESLKDFIDDYELDSKETDIKHIRSLIDVTKLSKEDKKKIADLKQYPLEGALSTTKLKYDEVGQFYLLKSGDAVYFVDNQGYDYPKYVGKLVNFSKINEEGGTDSQYYAPLVSKLSEIATPYFTEKEEAERMLSTFEARNVKHVVDTILSLVPESKRSELEGLMDTTVKEFMMTHPEAVEESAHDDRDKEDTRHWKEGEKVKIVKSKDTIEGNGGLEKGYGDMLAGKEVTIIKVKGEGVYDIKLSDGSEVYDVLGNEIFESSMNEGINEVEAMKKDLQSLNQHDTLDDTDVELLNTAAAWLDKQADGKEHAKILRSIAGYGTLDDMDHENIHDVIMYLSSKKESKNEDLEDMTPQELNKEELAKVITNMGSDGFVYNGEDVKIIEPSMISDKMVQQCNELVAKFEDKAIEKTNYKEFDITENQTEENQAFVQGVMNICSENGIEFK